MDVRRFGVVCDGQTNNATAINALLSHGRHSLAFHRDGCTGPFRVDAPIVVPADSMLEGDGVGEGEVGAIETTASTDLIAVAGDHVTLKGLTLVHRGTAGHVVDLGDHSYGTIADNVVIGRSATAASSLLYGYGAQNIFRNNRIENYRPHGWAIEVDGKTNPSAFHTTSVNWLIDGNFVFSSKSFGVPGGGVRIFSSSPTGGHAPQGMYLSKNVIQTEGRVNLLVEQVVDLIATDDTFDNGEAIVLAPVGDGIVGVQLHGGYVSTPLDKQGACLLQRGKTAAIDYLQVQGVLFSVCGRGIDMTAGNSRDLVVQGNIFTTITQVAIKLQGVERATIAGNVCDPCAQTNLDLSGAANGGPYVIDDNQFDRSGKLRIAKDVTSDVAFGAGNTGLRVAGEASASATLGASGCYRLSVKHGLAAPPDPAKILLSTGRITGSIDHLTASVDSVESKVVVVQVCAKVEAPGEVRVVMRSSL